MFAELAENEDLEVANDVDLCEFCTTEECANREFRCYEYRLEHGCSCGDCWLCL
jgi:hypothetical protein